jgi:hypothetical protein
LRIIPGRFTAIALGPATRSERLGHRAASFLRADPTVEALAATRLALDTSIEPKPPLKP